MAEQCPGGQWEDGEFDQPLFYGMHRLFRQNEWLDKCDEFLSLIQEPREGESEAEREFWEKMINKVKKHNAKISSGEPISGEIQERRKVPPLKLLSAIAICKKYKESEEIQSLGPNAIVGWTAKCQNAPHEYPRREGDVLIDLHPAHGRPNWRCGFCRFSKWIKEQELPKELEGWCKNVLNYLGDWAMGHKDFKEYQPWDEEWIGDVQCYFESPRSGSPPIMGGDYYQPFLEEQAAGGWQPLGEGVIEEVDGPPYLEF